MESRYLGGSAMADIIMTDKAAFSGNELFVAAASLVAGEAAAFAVPAFGGAWWMLALAAAAAAAAMYGWRLGRAWPAVVMLAGAALAARTDGRLSTLTSLPSDGPARERTLDLKVEETYPPLERRGAAESGERRQFRSSACGVPVMVAVTVPEGGEAPAPGETWRCRGWLSAPRHGRSRFGMYRLWAHRPGAAERVAPAPELSVEAVVRRVSDDLSRRAGIGLESDPVTADLHRAMILGRRAALPKNVRGMFVDAGTVHLFAISGLHVMIIAGVLMLLARLCFVDIRRQGVMVIPLLVAYTLVTGARPSAVRAASMAAICLAAPVFGRKGDTIAAWSLTALFVYALSPERLFDVGCTLSFTVMLGIALWLRASEGLHQGPSWLDARGKLLRDTGHPRLSGVVFTLGAVARSVKGGFVVSLAAWAAGVPIAAHVFGRFTPGGLLANVAVLPLAAVTVSAGMAGLALSYVWTPLAALANNVAALSTRLMVWCSSLVASIPGASVDVEPWPVSWCVAWYAVCIALLVFASRLASRRRTSWLRP